MDAAFVELLQFLLTGLTVGAVYALVAIGFSIIYNASHVINFAQGEFVMLGGMGSVFILATGVPLPLAILAAAALAVVVGLALERFAIEPARGADVITLIIITIGASLVIRGVAEVVWDKEFHKLPAFSGEDPINLLGATLQPQSLWVIGVGAVAVVALQLFFTRTVLGKAIIACSVNRDMARMLGIDVRMVMILSYGLAALLGALAGALITPIQLTNYEAGIMLGLKGFSAAMLGGLGNPMGGVAGGILLGVLESLGAGYLSSEYKDAIAFVIILLVLVFMPQGLFGRRATERV